jgi:hypothetical protein
MSDNLATHPQAQAPTIAFPLLAAPTVIPVGKLTSDAIARCNLRDFEYVVLEPGQGGMRLRPAGIEDQVKHEQEGGLGHTTYSLGEFLDEFTTAPSNPAPTFDRLAQFKRDYARLAPQHRELFRAAIEKFVSPLSPRAPGGAIGPLVRELEEHPGFFELQFDTGARAVYTFGRAVRPGQPHVIWCRIGTDDDLDRSLVTCNPDSARPAPISAR